MAVSKRTRFEVLRRDGHKCRYCGATAPDVKLTVDHVIPVALGGTDDPTNLVTACADCNSGKTSTSPDEHTVAQVAADSMRWQVARHAAIEKRAAEDEAMLKIEERFEDLWRSWDKNLDLLPGNWRTSIRVWMGDGLSQRGLEDALDIAVCNTRVRAKDVFRYMAGVIRNRIIELDKATVAELEAMTDDVK